MVNTSQHPPRPSDTPQERNLSEVQSSQEILQLKSTVDAITKRVGGVIEVMKNGLENQKKIEEIALTCESTGNFELVHMGSLIRNTGNVNEKISGGNTVLILAALYGNVEITKLLLARPEIQVNEKDNLGRTALVNAALYNSPETMKLLLAHPDIQVNKSGHDGTAIACTSDMDVIKLLLARPEIQVNEKNKNGRTALICAVDHGDMDVIKLLLAHPDIQVNEKNKNGRTALIFAAIRGHTEITRLLLTDPRLDFKPHNQGKKALEQAKTEEIKSLIEEAMKKQGMPF